MAWVRRQPRVVDLLDQGVSREPARYNSSRGRLLPHAQRHGFEAAHGQPAVEGAQNSALRILHKGKSQVQALRVSMLHYSGPSASQCA